MSVGVSSKAVTARYSGVPKDPEGLEGPLDLEVVFHKIEFEDKVILNVEIDGAMDTTFDIPVSPKATLGLDSTIMSQLEDVGVEPQILVGDHGNLKVQVVASQIGKLVQSRLDPKNLILSIGLRWFGRGDTTSEEDFTKLMFVLENVKLVL